MAIYIVDAKATKRRMVISVLQRRGIENYREFETGTAAWEAIVKQPPTFLILGEGLPDIESVALARRVRGTEATKHLAIVLISDRNEQEYVLGALESGVDDYLLTPFDSSVLVEKAHAAKERTVVRHEQAERIRRFEEQAMHAHSDEAPIHLDDSIASAAERLPLRRRSERV